MDVNVIEDANYSLTNIDAQIQKFVEIKENKKRKSATQTVEIELDTGNPKWKL